MRRWTTGATKTANTYLADKVALRVEHLPEGSPLFVLDAYAGRGVVWEAVKKLTGRDIRTLPVDKDLGAFFGLWGDNRIYLESLDLARFDAIDLDAYGVPYEQLSILFRRGYAGWVFVTFIQSDYNPYGGTPHQLLHEIGVSQMMIDKSPLLFGRRAYQYFLEWMGWHGVETIWHRGHIRKHYLAFQMVS